VGYADAAGALRGGHRRRVSRAALQITMAGAGRTGAPGTAQSIPSHCGRRPQEPGSVETGVRYI